ncbi:MAG: hypothetical protein ACLPY1_20695 [Terracidiphilus sp.]
MNLSALHQAAATLDSPACERASLKQAEPDTFFVDNLVALARGIGQAGVVVDGHSLTNR